MWSENQEVAGEQGSPDGHQSRLGWAPGRQQETVSKVPSCCGWVELKHSLHDHPLLCDTLAQTSGLSDAGHSRLAKRRRRGALRWQTAAGWRADPSDSRWSRSRCWKWSNFWKSREDQGWWRPREAWWRMHLWFRHHAVKVRDEEGRHL